MGKGEAKKEMQADNSKYAERRSKFTVTTEIELVDDNCGGLDETLEICLPLTCADTFPKIKDSATVFPSFFFVRRTVATLLLKLYNTRCCNASQKHCFKDSAGQLSL